MARVMPRQLPGTRVDSHDDIRIEKGPGVRFTNVEMREIRAFEGLIKEFLLGTGNVISSRAFVKLRAVD